jgi:hypothetical protein
VPCTGMDVIRQQGRIRRPAAPARGRRRRAAGEPDQELTALCVRGCRTLCSRSSRASRRATPTILKLARPAERPRGPRTCPLLLRALEPFMSGRSTKALGRASRGERRPSSSKYGKHGQLYCPRRPFEPWGPRARDAEMAAGAARRRLFEVDGATSNGTRRHCFGVVRNTESAPGARGGGKRSPYTRCWLNAGCAGDDSGDDGGCRRRTKNRRFGGREARCCGPTLR